MWTRDQNHRRADGDEPESRTELEPKGDRTNEARQQSGAEGLYKQVAAHPRQPPAKASARAGAERDQEEAENVGSAEDDAERCGSGRRKQREARDRDGWKPGDSFQI